MIVPIRIICSDCKQTVVCDYNTDKNIFPFHCKKCQISKNVGIHIGFHIGTGLHLNSLELKEKGDCQLSILMSGLAMECTTSYYYHRWRFLEELKKGNFMHEELENTIDLEIRDMKGFRDKANRTSGVMIGESFNEYIQKKEDIRKSVTNGYPSIRDDNPLQSIQEIVMWKRNEIAHRGHKKYKEEDARICCNVSSLYINILDRMEDERVQSERQC